MSKFELLSKIITFWLEVRTCPAKNKVSHFLQIDYYYTIHVYSKLILVT